MSQPSTLKPFLPGDIFVGATLLNVADDGTLTETVAPLVLDEIDPSIRPQGAYTR